VAWRRKTGDVQLPRLYAYLREEEEQWTVHGVAADDTERLQTKLNEVNAELQRRMHEPIPNKASGCGRLWVDTFDITECHEPTGADDFSIPSRLALASLVVAAEPERPRPLGSHAAHHHSLAAFAFCLSSLSSAAPGRYHLRQEPDAGNPLVWIRGGVMSNRDPYSTKWETA